MRALTKLAAAMVIPSTLLLGGCPSAVQVRPAWLDVADAETLRALSADDPRAERDLGIRQLVVDGDAEAAEATLRRAAERAPVDPLTWLTLAGILESHGRAQEAVRAYGRATEAAASESLAADFCAPAGLEPAPDPELCRLTALAIEESGARMVQRLEVAGHAEVARAVLDGSERRLGLPAAHLLRRVTERAARRRGDGEAARQEVLRAGCLLRWRAAGPFGPHPLQSFDVAHSPEGDETLGSAYDLGPGRGEQPTRAPDLSACEVQLAEPLARSGTWYVEGAIAGSEARSVVDLRLWAPTTSALVVWVGGQEVFRRDGRAEYQPSISTARFEIGTEPTRILVKLTSPSREPAFSIALRERATGRAPEVLDPASGPWPGRGRALDGEDLFAIFAPEPGEPISPSRAAVTYYVARTRLYWTIAEEALARVAEPSAPILLLRGGAAAHSPAAPSGVRSDRLLSDMRDALAGDPLLVEARITLANRLAGENQGREAMAMLLEGLEVQPECAELWSEVGGLARRLGLHARAVEAFERAYELDELACGNLRQLALMHDDLRLYPRADQELERLVQCDATTRTRADVLARSGRVEEALVELRRVLEVYDYPASLEPDLADLALRSGDPEEARRLWAHLAARWPRSESHEAALADLDGASSGLDAAGRRLAAASGRFPWEMSGLRRAAGVAGVDREIEAYRVDGAEHIRRYARSRATYDSPSVYVLDRAVYRVNEDMSTIRVVHQIVHVLTQEAVAPMSEFRTPRGGEVLTLRTIKADGTILEPLEFDGEGTTNLTGVEVGDFVEWEYVTWGGPSTVYPGGLVTPRFYFATPDTAMHLSELVVVAPEDVPVRYVGRGPSPPVGEAIRLGGLGGMRFATERVPSQVREPDMPSPNEAFPSIGAVIGESPEAAVASWHDGLLSSMRPDFRMRQLVREHRSPGQTEVELASTLYGYVLDHVQHGQGSASASHTLAAGRGNALVLLAALYRLAGFDPDVVYTWSLSSDRSGEYMVPSELATSLIRVSLDDQVHFVRIGSRHTPFGHVPSGIRGQPALVSAPEPEQVTIPESSPVDDVVEIRVDGAVGADGTVTVELSERYTGARASELRRDVSRIPAAERGQRGAAMLGAQYPGAIAEEVHFDGVEDRDAPMEVRGHMTSRMLGRLGEGGALMLPARLAHLVRYSRLARLSERRTTMIFGIELREVVVQRLRLPEGARVEQPCEGGRVESELGSFEVSCSVDDEGALVHRLELSIQPERIEAAAYPDFAALLRGYDEASATETRIALP